MRLALPILYSFRRCPYAMRARLALAVSEQPYAHREVVLRNKPPALLAASPKATVPVLVLPDGQVIEQSLDIMLWALRLNDPERWLSPQDTSLDEMLALIHANDHEFKPCLDRYKYPNRYAEEYAGDPAGFATEQRDLGARWLDVLQLQLSRSPSQRWLYGRASSLADRAIVPFVRQFAHTDASWFASKPWPQLQAWLADLEAGALYQSVMEKHAAWIDPSEPVTPSSHIFE